jgi:hypothetical protein
MKSTAEIHRLSELTIVPTSSKIALIDRGTATGVKNVRVLPIDMSGIFGQSTPIRDLLLGDGAPSQAPPPPLPGSSEWYRRSTDALLAANPRKAPSEKGTPVPIAPVVFKQIGERIMPTARVESPAKTGAINDWKAGYTSPPNVSFS